VNERDVEAIVRRVLAEAGLRVKIAAVAAVSGDETAGYSVQLHLDGDTATASAPVRCPRHYTPAVGDRVAVLVQGTRTVAIIGKVN